MDEKLRDFFRQADNGDPHARERLVHELMRTTGATEEQIHNRLTYLNTYSWCEDANSHGIIYYVAESIPVGDTTPSRVFAKLYTIRPNFRGDLELDELWPLQDRDAPGYEAFEEELGFYYSHRHPWVRHVFRAGGGDHVEDIVTRIFRQFGLKPSATLRPLMMVFPLRYIGDYQENQQEYEDDIEWLL